MGKISNLDVLLKTHRKMSQKILDMTRNGMPVLDDSGMTARYQEDDGYGHKKGDIIYRPLNAAEWTMVNTHLARNGIRNVKLPAKEQDKLDAVRQASERVGQLRLAEARVSPAATIHIEKTA